MIPLLEEQEMIFYLKHIPLYEKMSWQTAGKIGFVSGVTNNYVLKNAFKNEKK